MVNIRRIVFEKNLELFYQYLDVIADLADEGARDVIIDRYAAKTEGFNDTAAKLGHFDSAQLKWLIMDEVWTRHGRERGLDFETLDEILFGFRNQLLTATPTAGWIQLKPIIKILHSSGNLQFAVLGLPQVADVMRGAVPAINVLTEKGDEECGSGVILRSDAPGVGLVLTNKHVLLGRKIRNVSSSQNKFEVISEPIYHPTADIAKFNIILRDDTPQVNLGLDVRVLDPVVAMGFPRVPTAAGQFVMADRGEVNGEIYTIDHQRYVAISCHISPGNSGGPIFNDLGYCVGLVTQSGVADFGSDSDLGGTYRSTYHMAIPIDIVRQFVGAS